MISLKKYLITTGILLSLALISGVAVWYLYQDLGPQALEKRYESAAGKEANETAKSSEAAPSLEAEDSTSGTSGEITADSLTDAQKSMLQSFGIDSSNIVITETMISCAKTGVGEKRLSEIINGSAPTPYEALKLLPCVKSE